MINTCDCASADNNWLQEALYIRIVCLSVRPLTPISHYLVEAVWRSGNALVSINEVNLRLARLVLGWVTVSGFNSRCGTSLSWYATSHRGQLSLAIPSWVGAMSTIQRTVMPCDWGVKAGRVRVWVAGKTVIPLLHTGHI